VACWLVVGLALDRGAGLERQWAVGAATWLLLAGLLAAEDRGTRAQVAVAVVLATALEYVLSPTLGFYVYRLQNVPAYVPPGHGLVYLAAVALARRGAGAPAARPLAAAALAAGAAWAAWGVGWAARPDALGALLYLVFAASVLAGRAPLVYAAAFALTGALELLGTAAGAWTWAPRDPSGYLPAGNPPSGVAGAYCLLDALALAGGPVALRFAARLSERLAGPLAAARAAVAPGAGGAAGPP
jgi:hypothetical protein